MSIIGARKDFLSFFFCFFSFFFLLKRKKKEKKGRPIKQAQPKEGPFSEKAPVTVQKAKENEHYRSEKRFSFFFLLLLFFFLSSKKKEKRKEGPPNKAGTAKRRPV